MWNQKERKNLKFTNPLKYNQFIQAEDVYTMK